MPDPIHAVNPTQPPDVALAGSAQAASTQGGPAAQPAPGAVDSADVARAELLLATIAAAGRNIPTVDQSRIAELQNAILSGSYQVDPKQVAQKIAEIEQLLVPEGL